MANTEYRPTAYSHLQRPDRMRFANREVALPGMEPMAVRDIIELEGPEFYNAVDAAAEANRRYYEKMGVGEIADKVTEDMHHVATLWRMHIFAARDHTGDNSYLHQTNRTLNPQEQKVVITHSDLIRNSQIARDKLSRMFHEAGERSKQIASEGIIFQRTETAVALM